MLQTRLFGDRRQAVSKGKRGWSAMPLSGLSRYFNPEKYTTLLPTKCSDTNRNKVPKENRRGSTNVIRLGLFQIMFPFNL